MKQEIPTLDFLGEPSWKFDYYVLYFGKEEEKIYLLPNLGTPKQAKS